MSRVLPFLVVLLAVAFFTRVDFFFYLLYTLFGIYMLGRAWARRSLAAVSVVRRHEPRVFFGESFTVHVDVVNRGRLPVLWLRLADTAPFELSGGLLFQRVLSLLPRERQHHDYRLLARRRGYYQLGPFVSSAGDLLGSATYQSQGKTDDPVIVYPRIVPLRNVSLPSQSPFGTLPSRQRLFEDPTRVRGVRGYQPGDSLRRIDWKTSARVASLQVRRYEPSIALETAVFLNLAGEQYPPACRPQATEMGIVVAASVAVHLAEKRQAVGLVVHGRDPLAPQAEPGSAGAVPSLPVRKGREHLMHLLDLLARITTIPDGEAAVPFDDVLSRGSLALPWGSTLLAITAAESEGMFDTLLALRRRGLMVILVLTCPGRGFKDTVARAGHIGVQVVDIESDRDLDRWR